MEIYTGVRVKAFDHLLFKDDVKTPLSVTVKPATVIKIYKYRSTYQVVDLIFDHRGEVSKGHFIEGIKPL